MINMINYQCNQILHRLRKDITHVLQVWLTQFFPILTPFWKPPQPATGRWKTWAWRRPTSRSCFQGWKSSGETSLLSGFFDILLVMAVLLGSHRAEQAKLNSGLDVCLGKADTLGISFAASSSYSSLTSSRSAHDFVCGELNKCYRHPKKDSGQGGGAAEGGGDHHHQNSHQHKLNQRR